MKKGTASQAVRAVSACGTVVGHRAPIAAGRVLRLVAERWVENADDQQVLATDLTTAILQRIGWKSLHRLARERTSLCLSRDERMADMGEEPTLAAVRARACEAHYGRAHPAQ